MGLIVQCPGGRVIEQRAVTTAPGVDDWFHADDGSHCGHRVEVESLRRQLAGAVQVADVVRVLRERGDTFSSRRTRGAFYMAAEVISDVFGGQYEHDREASGAS